MEKKEITKEMALELKKPLPKEAIKQHPTKSYLSSIKAIYVTERLSDVFGVGSWRINSELVEKGDKGMIVVKVKLTIPEYGIELESYGGNDNGGESSKNFDLGDAYKGAVTDGITKIGSWLYIGIDVFKGLPINNTPKQTNKTPPTNEADLVIALDEVKKCASVQNLQTIWENWKTFQTNKEFTNAVTMKKKELITPQK